MKKNIMKKITIYFFCFILLATGRIKAQNIFPDSGNVGIGTTTPFYPLTVVGDVGIGAIRISGDGQFAIGQDALITNTTGESNMAVGVLALDHNLSGSYNTALGIYSLDGNTIGEGNTGVGFYSLKGNIGGNDNTAVGHSALFNNGISNYNVAMGSQTMVYNIKGDYNTALGYSGLYYNIKGDYNTSVGALAMGGNKTGNYNTAVGYDAEVSSANLTNASAFGNGALVDASNKVRVGNSSVTSIGGQVGWTTYSDARIKNTIQQNVPGLEFINLLNPVTYHYDIQKQDALVGSQNTDNVEDKYAIEKMQFTGFIAQEVDAAAQKINYDFSGVDKSGNIWGLRYSEFVVPIVKAVQQLAAQNANQDTEANNRKIEIENLQAENAALINKNIELENRLAQIESILNINTTADNNEQETENFKQVTLSSEGNTAMLGQNIPNPFNGTTIIPYSVPESISRAQIKITSANGVAIKTFEINKGNGSIEINASQIPSGVYTYSLLADGKIIDTKQMVLTK